MEKKSDYSDRGRINEYTSGSDILEQGRKIREKIMREITLLNEVAYPTGLSEKIYLKKIKKTSPEEESPVKKPKKPKNKLQTRELSPKRDLSKLVVSINDMAVKIGDLYWVGKYKSWEFPPGKLTQVDFVLRRYSELVEITERAGLVPILQKGFSLDNQEVYFFKSIDDTEYIKTI